MPPASQDQDPEFVHRTFSAIAGRYVLANHVLSFGMDRLWRARVARLVAACDPGLVLDVATGSGDLAAAVAAAAPRARVVGVDFCAPMLREARRRGVGELVVADGLALPFADGGADALTIGYGLRNMADWDAALREFARVLAPGGLLAVLDFSTPRSAWLRGPYRIYLHRVLPALGGWITGRREAYAYLGESIERFPSGESMCARIAAAGFREPRWAPQFGGVSSLYHARRAS